MTKRNERKIALNYIYLSKHHSGGKDQVGLNLLKGLQEMGVTKQMAVICYPFSVDTIRRIAPDVEIITIKGKSGGSELKRMFQVCMTNTFRIPTIIKKHSIEVIYHLSYNNGLRRLPAKTVMIPHDIKQIAHRKLANVTVPWYKYILYRIMYALDYRHNDKIVAISDFDKGEMYQYYGKYKDKIIRIYNPVCAEEKEIVTQKEPFIMAMNLQFHHKNIITLLKAYEQIMEKMPEKLYLVGSVPERVSYLKEYVKEHHMEDRVVFTGFVPDEQVVDMLSKTSLYVNPTLFEGFGMPAVEAMIYGAPVLLSGIPANVEVTQDRARYYEPPEDADELAQAILQALADMPSAQELQTNADAMLKSYHYRKIAEEYYKLFLEM